MKALVTGANGLLGFAIARALHARGDTVHALVRRRSAELETLGSRTFLGDVRDRASIEEACRGVDVVFHVAGVSGIWGPWSHYYANNTQGTLNVLAACQKLAVGRLVYTSSPSVTFDGGDQENVNESAPYARRWLCHYAHSKALAEQAVLAASGAQLATCALRPHLIWGLGDRQLVPRLLERARQGKLRRVGEGRNLIDTIYVDNAADAHVLAAEALAAPSPAAGRAYFISQGEPVNCWKWIDELLVLAGLPPVRRSVPLPIAYAAGAVLEGVYGALRLKHEPPMTRFLAAQLGRSHYFDISRARADLGYVPRIPSAEGMQRIGEWLRTGAH